jgi:integrase
MRAMKAEGNDPIDQRRKQEKTTFAAVAEAYIADRKLGKSEQQWRQSLQGTLDTIGSTPVAAVTTSDVVRCMKVGNLWERAHETASRVRGRIEAILTYAAAHGHRSAEPVADRRLVEMLLPRAGRGGKHHHEALPVSEVPAFMKALMSQPTVGARALAFTVLTASRTGEVLGAEWSEVDLEAKVWTIPAARMKGAREHRVPLTDAAVALLGPAGKGFIFTAGSGPLSGRTMRATLDRMKVGSATVHGFRSSFRDWCSETGVSREVAEQALAHTVGGVEGAYNRSDLFARRRVVMQGWSDYCEGRGR